MHDTTAAGHDTDSVGERIWFLPSGDVHGERNQHRVRGWAIVAAAAIVLWGVVALVVWGVVSLF